MEDFVVFVRHSSEELEPALQQGIQLVREHLGKGESVGSKREAKF
jgi:hypothetical protein